MKTKMKKVIFIGGTSYSGSTFFDMILANDPRGFSCGEVHALFNPYRPHHINPLCGCADNRCQVWSRALKNGKKNLYSTIFKLFPEVRFIVDSSKNVFWIKSQTKHLLRNGIECRNVLIWKSPLELACSFRKRNQIGWEKEWLVYHRLYFKAVESWKAIRYRDFTMNKEVLKNVCAYLAIPYFPGKENYWEKKHHTLFGNASAKIHLYKKDSVGYKREGETFGKILGRSHSNIEETHKSIYYKPVDDQSLEDSVTQKIRLNIHLSEIMKLLNYRDISDRSSDGHTVEISKLRMPLILFKMRAGKGLFIRWLKKYKYRIMRYLKTT